MLSTFPEQSQAPQGAVSGTLQPREGARRRRNGANPNISSATTHSWFGYTR